MMKLENVPKFKKFKILKKKFKIPKNDCRFLPESYDKVCEYMIFKNIYFCKTLNRMLHTELESKKSTQ